MLFKKKYAVVNWDVSIGVSCTPQSSSLTWAKELARSLWLATGGRTVPKICLVRFGVVTQVNEFVPSQEDLQRYVPTCAQAST